MSYANPLLSRAGTSRSFRDIKWDRGIERICHYTSEVNQYL